MDRPLEGPVQDPREQRDHAVTEREGVLDRDGHQGPYILNRSFV